MEYGHRTRPLSEAEIANSKKQRERHMLLRYARGARPLPPQKRCSRCGKTQEPGESWWPDDNPANKEDTLCQMCWEAVTSESWWAMVEALSDDGLVHAARPDLTNFCGSPSQVWSESEEEVSCPECKQAMEEMIYENHQT
jgi:hypothetical protein